MSQVTVISLLSITSIIGYLITLAQVNYFLPQLIALSAVIFFLLHKYHLPYIYLLSLIINLIVFSTGGVHSPYFFLVYFILFAASFQFIPLVSLSFAFVEIFLLSQTLNSQNSLIPLVSLLFISPISYLLSRQRSVQQKVETTLAIDETDFLFWLNLKFKKNITTIIDSASLLLSSPGLTHSQKNELLKIKSQSKTLLESSQNISQEIDQNSDEI